MRRLPSLLPILVLACTAQQRAESARSADVFACEVAVLAPHLPEAVDAAELALAVVKGAVQLPLALARLGLTVDQANAVVADFNACFAGAPDLQPLPAELTTTLVAPPPAYGNRVF